MRAPPARALDAGELKRGRERAYEACVARGAQASIVERARAQRAGAVTIVPILEAKAHKHDEAKAHEHDLATAPVQAKRFGAARRRRAASMLEDYTELIADLIACEGEARTTDIAERLGVAHPTASKAIARLKREGLAVARPYRGVFLTDAGKEMAERSRQRHRLVVDLLLAVGVPLEAAEADAEGVEHYVSQTTLRAFAAFVKSHG